MKKIIALRLILIIMSVTLISLIVNYFLQIGMSRRSQHHNALLKIEQIEQILDQNQKNLETLELSQKEDSIIRAEAAAYIVHKNPDIITDRVELQRVASLLQIDELHIFNEEGTIYAGTEPKYYGYSFYSGEQMKFFLPILSNKYLIICQDITPNTAEKKMMQYTAVWDEDGKNIIQIGIEPYRILEARRLIELSYLFSMMSFSEGETLYAVDMETGIIKGCTDQTFVGQTVTSAGFVFPLQTDSPFKATVQSQPVYCCFKDIGNLWIGVTKTESVLYRGVASTLVIISVYVVLSSLIILGAILIYLNSYVIEGINTIIRKLAQITAGDLDVKVNVVSAPEFAVLSEHINIMVLSLLNNTVKLSKIFDMANVMIGVYEYNSDMKRVRATRKVQTLLFLDDDSFARLKTDKTLFQKYIDDICRKGKTESRDIYRISESPVCYLHILPFSDEKDTVGIISDVTESVLEKQHIEHDRDYDVLTGLLNRRAFYALMNKIMEQKEFLTESALCVFDMDELKTINDTYGHMNGDIAIEAVGKLLMKCSADRKISARLGGDEFVLFIYGYRRDELECFLQELHTAMMETQVVLTDGTIRAVRLSGGYVFYPEQDVSYSRLLGYADSALYNAKRNNKGSFVPYH